VYNKKDYNNTIDKIMQDYLENKKIIEDISEDEDEDEDLVVNFDITYTNGKNKKFSVNSEGNVLNNKKEMDAFNEDEYTGYKEINEEESQGEITVYATIKTKDGTKIKRIKINLYKINGVSPELIQSLETDSDGKVVFSGIPEGSYRVIEFIDKRYFNKPIYVDWNEVTIDSENKNHVVYAINTIKVNCGNKFK